MPAMNKSTPSLLQTLLLGLMAAAVPAVHAEISLTEPYRGFVGPEACRECHAELVESQSHTAHYLASMPANEQTVQGSFETGRNRLPTRDPRKDLLMSNADGALKQSLVYKAADRDVTLRSAEFAIVIGLVKGQTYLYWRDDLLCQLPASYAKSGDLWAYSPGFPDGVAWFDRVIKPDCMECHATLFENVLPDKVVKSDKQILGVTCESCHGPGLKHVQHHQRHPEQTTAAHMPSIAELSRDQQLEACGYCHAGIKPDSRKRPAFSFRPGHRLADFFDLKAQDSEPVPEVHGNQMGLLMQSQCFQQSEELSCNSCHDSHRVQRGDLGAYAQRCLSCHVDDLAKHTQAPEPENLLDGCVDCHMPLVDSKLIDVRESGHKVNFSVRNHRIGVYGK